MACRVHYLECNCYSNMGYIMTDKDICRECKGTGVVAPSGYWKNCTCGSEYPIKQKMADAALREAVEYCNAFKHVLAPKDRQHIETLINHALKGESK